jgi:hypothetical protein
MSIKLKAFLIIMLTWVQILPSVNICMAQQSPAFKNKVESTLAHSARINQKNGGVISRKELEGATGLTLTAPYDSTFQIVSFVLTRVRKGESPVEVKNENGSNLTVEMKELVSKILPGDKLYFEYINCKSNDGTKLKLAALSFVVE